MQPNADDSGAPRSPDGVGRRRFLEIVGALAGLTVGAIVAVPAVGFMIAPLFRSTPRRWRSVGTLDQFAVGSTVLVGFEDASSQAWAGITSKTGAWLRRVSDTEFIAFAINCTHLGCPVRWEDGAQLFMCPCHGGVYNRDGSVAAGPPPQSLPRYPVRVRRGTVEIETSRLPIT